MKSAKEILELVRKGGLYPYYREDIFIKWRERENILEKWQEEIRADERQKCFEAYMNLESYTNLGEIQRATLNAGKLPESEEKGR